jgi:NAD-dependent DNA ligase
MALTSAERAARHYAKHREKKLAWMKEYYVRNRERIQDINRDRQRRYAAQRRARGPEVVVADVSAALHATPEAPEAASPVA